MGYTGYVLADGRQKQLQKASRADFKQLWKLFVVVWGCACKVLFYAGVNFNMYLKNGKKDKYG